MKYTPENILSLQFMQTTQLQKLSRAELFNRMQLVRTVEPIIEEAFRISELRHLEENSDSAPHGSPWHVSFHASQFPGDDPMACGRQALYRMMDFPSAEPTSRKLRQTADAGKAFEVTLVEAWARSGMLLSSNDPDNQTGFEWNEAWLTGSVDAVILPPGWNKPLPIECKQRKHEIVQEMNLGRGPFPEHISQIKVQIAMVRNAQQRGFLWQDYDLCDHGIIYYGSRDDPDGTTAEFRVDFDPNFMEQGVEKLKRWIAYFEEDVLPELKPGKRSTIFGHPNGWRWSYQPCQWCSFKKTCQLDFREGVTQLSESVGVARAKRVRSNYDYEAARQRVRKRWEKKKPKERV